MHGSHDGQFNNPSDVAVDSMGYVYVVDSGNNRIQKFTPDGNFITTWGAVGKEDGQFQEPDGIAIDSSGDVYVSDRFNGRIQKFSLTSPQVSPTSKPTESRPLPKDRKPGNTTPPSIIQSPSLTSGVTTISTNNNSIQNRTEVIDTVKPKSSSMDILSVIAIGIIGAAFVLVYRKK
jgi:DNA-binding beta-propeller fold protein YncE